MTHEEYLAIKRFADDLRRHFPIPQVEDDFTDRVRTIFYRHFWEILAIEEQKALFEFEVNAGEMEKANGQ